MIFSKRIHFIYLLSVIALVASTFLTQPVQVHAQADWRGFSADVDGDGLPNDVEDAGWHNAAGGPFVTDYMDADSDDDGLTDGKEKLYDTDPLNDRSPGIYVDYQNDLETREYFSWQRFGSRYVALPSDDPEEMGSAVVRRGATFSVGGPAAGELLIEKSLEALSDLTVVRNTCSGRWEVTVPEDGTVGIYTLTVQDGGWSASLYLYVVFEIPSDLSDSFIDNFLYDDNPNRSRDQGSIGYYESESGTHLEYDHRDYAWIPLPTWQYWITHGYAWRFNTQHYSDFVFEDHVMPAINGETTTWEAANALGHRVDDVTCFGYPNPLGNSWCVLNPSSCSPSNENQCTNIANLLTAFNRAAGIPARPLFTDWRHGTFDHSTEVWSQRLTGGEYDWFVMRGYNGYEGDCIDSNHYTGGINQMRQTSGWYNQYYSQGVYAGGEDWYWADLGGGSPEQDVYRMASWDFDFERDDMTAKLVKKDWFETRYTDYLRDWEDPPTPWPAEPEVTGSPPDDWPSVPDEPIAEFMASPTVGTVPMEVEFTDQSISHVNSWSWNFGDNGTSNEQNPVHTYAATGTYTVTLTVQGAGGSDTETKTNYIQVLDASLLTGQGGIFTTSGSSPVQFGKVVRDYGLDLDGDGRFDQLVFEVEVNALQEGDYWIRGVLGGDYTVPVGGGLIEAISHAYLPVGLHTVQLAFDGMDIYMTGADGPYTLISLSMTDLPDPTKSEFAERELAYVQTGYQTSGYRHSDFGVAGATLSGAYSHYAVDADGDGLADAVVVETGLNVQVPGAYTVQGVLYDGQEEMVSQASWSGTGPGVTLMFEGLRDTEGPYTLKHLHVRNAAGEATDGATDVYQLGELPELSATPLSLGVQGAVQAEIGATFVITDGYAATRIDNDGDGQYDELVITVNVEVEPGEGGQPYRIEGWLVDEDDSLISWATNESKTLGEGVHPLSLAFDGRIIRERGLDGPYTLVALKALGGTYDVLAEVNVAYTTPAYSHDEFEEPGVLPVTSVFDDNMENGEDQWGATGGWTLSDQEWYSYNHAWGTEDNGALTTVAVDLSDYASPTLRFRTCYAMQPGENSGRVRVSTNGSDWTALATYSDSTSSWSTEFVDLSDYGSQPSLQVRFSAASDGGLRWVIDDVSLLGWEDHDGDGRSTIDEDTNGDGDPTNDDRDGDGIPNYLEPNNVDTDGDGLNNHRDPDDDGDGIPTADEDADGNGDPMNDDSDGDGTPDYLDADDDNDGVPTADEDVDGDGDPTDDDTDGDGTPDYLDPDDDGDGVLTTDEDVEFVNGDPTDDDTDNDGIPNYLDPDDDGDGILTTDEDVEVVNGDPTDDDTDNDGIPNYLDPDDDGDGVDTADEDFNGDGDPSNDDSDGDTTPNYLDTDDDGDGILTRDETNDQDGDNVPDYLEPNNVDTDGDTINNHLDNDDDGDGVPTAEEDWNQDGNPTNDDGNANGIPDYLDPEISESPVKPIYLPLVIK